MKVSNGIWQHTRFPLAAATLAVIVACGGGGGGGVSGGSTTTIGGLAIDGYLENAKVCLDLNLNFKCDAGEPSAITNAKGEYSIPYSGGDAAGLVVITETTKDTKDTDDNGLTFEQANRSPFVLAAPVPEGATNDVKITPLTTVVTTNSLTENVSGGKLALADIKAAMASLQDTLGVDPSKDLLKLDVTNDETLRPVAQLLSHTLGEIQKAVTNNDASKMRSAVLSATSVVTGLLEEGQVPASVTAALAKPPAERAAALTQIAEVKSAITSATKTVNLGGASADPKQILKEGLVIAEVDSGYNPVDPTKEMGIGYYKRGEFLDVEYIKYDADTKAFAEIRRVWDKGWVKKAEWNTEYSLTPKGNWVPTEDSPFDGKQGSISFTSNCINIKSHTDLDYSERVCLEEKDLSNLLISEVNAGYCRDRNGLTPDQTICKAAKFKSGSKGYEGTFSIVGADAYMAWIPNRASDREWHYGKFFGQLSEATSIAAFIDNLIRVKEDKTFFLGINDYTFSIRLKSYDATTRKGVFSWFYDHDNNYDTAPQDAGESAFEVKEVAGVSVLVYKPSLRYHQIKPGDMVGRDFLFVAKDNQIRNGEVQYKDVREQLSLNGFFWLGNKAMLESILSGLIFNGVTWPAFPFSDPSDK